MLADHTLRRSLSGEGAGARGQEDKTFWAKQWLSLGQRPGGPRHCPLQEAMIYELRSEEKPPLMWLQTPIKGSGRAAQD